MTEQESPIMTTNPSSLTTLDKMDALNLARIYDALMPLNKRNRELVLRQLATDPVKFSIPIAVLDSIDRLYEDHGANI
jgi:hypothetical protein